MGVCNSIEEGVWEPVDLTPALDITASDHVTDYFGIDHIYMKFRKIYEGENSIVSEVSKLKGGDGCLRFAMKQTICDQQSNVFTFVQEIRALKKLKSLPNVLAYHDHWMDKNSMYLITEYCAHGTLLDKILNTDRYSESVAASFIKTILNVVAVMHSQNLIHRDLKPENILFGEDQKQNHILKVADFGESITLADDAFTTVFAGSQFFMAPQLFKMEAKKYFKHLAPEDLGRFSGLELKKADVWSIGVITYLIVCGGLPFEGIDVSGSICRGKFRWPKAKHIQLSKQCKSFIESLLEFDDRKRLSAQQALQHPWLVGEASKDDIGPVFLQQLSGFHSEMIQAKSVLHLLNSSSESFF